MPKLKARYVNTRSYNHFNAEKFSADISRIPWNALDLLDSVDAQACLNNFAPVKTIKIKHRSIPFMNEDIKEQIFIRNNLHKIACQTGSVEDWNGFKQQRCKVKLALKTAEVEYYNEQILSNQKNCASLWKTTRNALPTYFSGKKSFNRFSKFSENSWLK